MASARKKLERKEKKVSSDDALMMMMIMVMMRLMMMALEMKTVLSVVKVRMTRRELMVAEIGLVGWLEKTGTLDSTVVEIWI